MTAVRDQGRSRELDERALLDAAISVCRERGYQATSVKDLAAATVVS